MLIDVELGYDPIAEIISGGVSEKRIDRGQYISNHFNLDLLLPVHHGEKWEKYAHIEVDGEWFGSYGVCDSPDQFMEKLGKHLEAATDEYVIGFVRLRKDEQEERGGWRWHKWGEYIGEQDPQCEYLYDEPVIEEVYTYHFYKRIKNDHRT